jgi:hypothetical protein
MRLKWDYYFNRRRSTLGLQAGKKLELARQNSGSCAYFLPRYLRWFLPIVMQAEPSLASARTARRPSPHGLHMVGM